MTIQGVIVPPEGHRDVTWQEQGFPPLIFFCQKRLPSVDSQSRWQMPSV